MNKIFFIVYLVILSASFIASFLSWKTLPGRFRLFSLMLGVTLIIESFAFYYLFYAKVPTQFMYHFYLPLTYGILAYIYAGNVQAAWLKKLILVSIPGFAALHLYLTLFVQKLHAVNSYAVVVASFLIVALALQFFFQLLQQEESSVPLLRNPLFWISSGNLIFYAGVFFLMGLLNFIMRELPDLAPKLMYINYSLNYILYTLYSIGFLCTIRNRRSLL